MQHATLPLAPSLGARLAQWGRLLALSARVQWPFYVLALAYALTTYMLLRNVPSFEQLPLDGLAESLITGSIGPGIVAVIVFRLVQYVAVIKPESPIKQGIADLRELFTRPAAIITALPLVAAMVVFNKGLLELKPMIPVLKPFTWDSTLMHIDRALHFGMDPWRLLQPILGHDAITFGIGLLYNFWFLALFGTFMWFGFSRQVNTTRTQFFVAYMLTWWLGGGLLALFMSSAGPVYYGAIGLSPDPYADLFAYLKDVDTRLPLWSLDAQTLLWDGYSGKVQPIGISAFPSMHNASAVLFALAAWRQSRTAGLWFTAYAVVIAVGSVHLGWHYAVDAYGSVALALFMWWVAGFFARWHAQRPSTQALNEGLTKI